MSKKIMALAGVLIMGGCAHKAPSSPAPAPKPPGAAIPAATPRVESPAFWRADGQAILARARNPASTQTSATSLILFVGDGMGISTVTAARILDGQKKGGAGEENQLSFEQFPATALAKTYNTDLQTPEAAGSMSAIMTGVKTRGAAIAIDQTPESGDCLQALGHEARTLLEQAKDAGLSVGVVSTARITHAVPAATYAHVSDADWEIDARMPKAARVAGCRDIARQLVEFDHRGGLDVVLGGGRLAFMTAKQKDPQETRRMGARLDDRDLIAQWMARHPDGRYIWNASQLKSVDWAAISGPIMGLFAPDNMAFEADRIATADDQPSLSEMTEAAVTALRRNPKGYVLVVDAGGIDLAHHAGNARLALTDTIELSQAVGVAAKLTSPDDTLIVVTADHSHTLTVGGYPKRGNPILGLARGRDGVPELDKRGVPYTTLSYANGPGAGPTPGDQPPLNDAAVASPSYLPTASVPMIAETHGGEDVPVYAQGPGSQWVRGVIEQHGVYWIMHAALKGLQEPAAPAAKHSALKRWLPAWPFGRKAPAPAP